MAQRATFVPFPFIERRDSPCIPPEEGLAFRTILQQLKKDRRFSAISLCDVPEAAVSQSSQQTSSVADYEIEQRKDSRQVGAETRCIAKALLH